MKSSFLVCPFDQISILILKLCPIVRTALHRISVHCWERKYVPRIWKYSFTMLVYKKDCPQIPSKYSPSIRQGVLIVNSEPHVLLFGKQQLHRKFKKASALGCLELKNILNSLHTSLTTPGKINATS